MPYKPAYRRQVIGILVRYGKEFHSLVVCLLNTKQFRTAKRIIGTVIRSLFV